MAIGTAAAIALGVGALGSAAIGASAASKAGKAQVAAADKGVEEQRAAREEMRRLLEPYVAAGGPALEAQMGALGLRGAEAQQAYVSSARTKPILSGIVTAARRGRHSAKCLCNWRSAWRKYSRRIGSVPSSNC
jgi:hypothetical protein